jgi:hypothetical protein
MNFAQLVVDATGSKVRSLPRNPGDHEDFQRPDDDQYIPALGSLDLMRLAIWSEDHQHPVVGVELRDRSMSPIDEGAVDEAEASLLDAIRQRDLTLARSALATGDRSPYTLVAIEIETETMGDIKVARSGAIEAPKDVDVIQFVAPAWSALHLS